MPTWSTGAALRIVRTYLFGMTSSIEDRWSPSDVRVALTFVGTYLPSIKSSIEDSKHLFVHWVRLGSVGDNLHYIEDSLHLPGIERSFGDSYRLPSIEGSVGDSWLLL